MSRARTALLAAAATASLAITGCKSVPADESAARDAEMQAAIETARAPASPEEIAAANRADPLTRANFWGKEHAKDPENLGNSITFAESLRAIGSNKRAIEVASQTALIHPGNADLMMIIGRSLVAQQKYLPAAQAFTRASEYDPEKAAAWAALGTSLDRLDRHLDAQVAYKRALAIEPNRTSTLTNYGLSLALMGDIQGAEAQLKIAAAQPDADLRVLENLALVQGLQGKYNEMATTSSAHAPNAIVQQNVEALQAMISPARSWENLSENAVIGQLPDASMTAQPLPADTETPSSSATTGVADTSLGSVESTSEPAGPASKPALRGALD